MDLIRSSSRRKRVFPSLRPLAKPHDSHHFSLLLQKSLLEDRQSLRRLCRQRLLADLELSSKTVVKVQGTTPRRQPSSSCFKSSSDKQLPVLAQPRQRIPLSNRSRLLRRRRPNPILLLNSSTNTDPNVKMREDPPRARATHSKHLQTCSVNAKLLVVNQLSDPSRCYKSSLVNARMPSVNLPSALTSRKTVTTPTSS